MKSLLTPQMLNFILLQEFNSSCRKGYCHSPPKLSCATSVQIESDHVVTKSDLKSQPIKCVLS